MTPENPYAPPGVDVAAEPPPESHPEAPPPAPRPKMAADAKLALAYKTTDPLEAELLVQALEAEGIATAGVGSLSGASIGAGQSIIDKPLFVAEADLARAREVIDAFLNGTPEMPDFPDDEPAALVPERRGVKLLAWLIVGVTIFSLVLAGVMFVVR